MNLTLELKKTMESVYTIEISIGFAQLFVLPQAKRIETMNAKQYYSNELALYCRLALILTCSRFGLQNQNHFDLQFYICAG